MSINELLKEKKMSKYQLAKKAVFHRRDLSIVCVRISNNINRHHYFHHSFWS